MAQDTKNFKVSEFACKHCGENKIDQRVLNMAQVIRAALGVPVRVNSGYRCETHNRNVGGVKGSQHTFGLAADLSCSLGARAMVKKIRELYAAGKLPDLSFCKEYSSWVHIDCGKKRNNMWDVKSA